MANATLFNTSTRKTDATNEAGGPAYLRSDKAALAQYAATSVLQDTFYASNKVQLDEILKLARSVPVDFLAKVAVYSRQNAYLKDVPALLMAVLATRESELVVATKDPEAFYKLFPRVIDNGRMVRNFVQIMRSGVVGRRSLGSLSKKAVQQWLDAASDEYIFKASVGNNPSIADVIKLVHPKPKTPSRAALYAYLIGKPYNKDSLPLLVKQFEEFKAAPASNRTVPNVPFQMLTSQNLSDEEWVKIAENGPWQFTRMNLNTFQRHNVFTNEDVTAKIADRLKNADLIKKARQYPHQVLSAYYAAKEVPVSIKEALHEAVQLCAGNVPQFVGTTAILVDSSGSMSLPSANDYLTRNEVASLFAAVIFAKNKEAKVYEFDTTARQVQMNPLDSVFTNAQRCTHRGGATDVSCSLKKLRADGIYPDNIIIISDNQSWCDVSTPNGSSTMTMVEFKAIKKQNKNSKLVLMDLTPTSTSQVKDRKDVLNIGGFSDAVFDVISAFTESGGHSDFWVDKIEKSVTL